MTFTTALDAITIVAASSISSESAVVVSFRASVDVPAPVTLMSPAVTPPLNAAEAIATPVVLMTSMLILLVTSPVNSVSASVTVMFDAILLASIVAVLLITVKRKPSAPIPLSFRTKPTGSSVSSMFMMLSPLSDALENRNVSPNIGM